MPEGREEPRRYKHLNAIATTQIELDKGELVRVVINTNGGAGNLLDLYDGHDTSGNLMASIDTTKSVTSLEYHIRFKNGLFANLHVAAAADVTIVWQVYR